MGSGGLCPAHRSTMGRPAAAPAAAAASARTAAPVPRPAEFEDEEEIHLGVDDDDDAPVLDTDDALTPPPAAHKAAPKPLEPEIDLGIDLEGEEELSAQFIDEDEPPPAPAAARPPVAAAPLEDDEFVLEEEAPAPLPDAGFEDLDFEVPAPPTVTPLAARPSQADEPATSAPPDLARVLDEVDSYISLGFVDDAKQSLRDVRHRFPDHPALAAKLSELGIDLAADDTAEHEAGLAREAQGDPLDDLDLGSAEDRSGSPTAEHVAGGEHPMADDSISDDLGLHLPESAGAPAESGGIDLGDELNDLFGAQAAVEETPEPAATDLGDTGLADIFKEFKKGVDKQLGKEDYDTRYNLGIAYKEMGLIDEAIAEFQLAAKDVNRTLECSSMLGICFMEKGMPKLAVKWFDKGLKAPGRSEEEYSALRYDLATAHEAAGEAQVALTLFTDLYGQDANFRDVAAKVRDLRAALG